MTKGTGKEDGAIIDILTKQEHIEIKRYTHRRVKSGKISVAARMLATAAAEDANTAEYVKAYIAGNFGAREDYIEYMADKFQFMMNGGKL